MQPNWHFHFVKADHRARLAFIKAMGPTQYRFLSVAVHKPNLKKTYNFSRLSFLYFYAAKLLLGRISWLCRQRRERLEGIYLSSRRGLREGNAKEYLRELREGYFSEFSNSIKWDFVNHEALYVVPNKTKIGFQLADLMASAVGHSICPTPYGITEPRYMFALRDHIYAHQASRLGYGLKFFPRLSDEMRAEPRFEWLEQFGR